MVGVLLAGGVAASLVAGRLRVPALLLFLAIGILIGSDVAGWVSFSDYGLAKSLGVIALALILFDGGLRSGWSEIRPVLGISLSLAVIGTVVTAAITGLVAAPLLGISTLEGLLLGAVLSSVASLATAAVSFGAATTLHGSGFLAVYLTGLMLGDAAIPARRTIGAFHDGLAWVAQMGLFVMLGLLVFPGRLGEVAVDGTIIALVLALVARPVGALVSTAPFKVPLAESLVLGWAGLRGAVPVVLATFVVVAKVPGAERVFDVVFFAVVISTLLQGTTVEWFARRLGMTTNEPALPAPLSESGTIRRRVRRSSSSRSPRRMRSSGRGSVTWACHARRWSA